MKAAFVRVLVAGIILALACAIETAQAAPCDRGGTAFRDEFWRQQALTHILVGQVFKGDTPIAIEPGACERSPLQQLVAEVWQTIRGGGVVLLGEVHDNPQHHLVREDILWPRWEAGAPTSGFHPGAVFEHIRADQKPLLDHFYDQASRSRRLWLAEDLLRVLGWKDSGWPDAEIFRPLYDGALWAGMPILPGDTPREQIKALAKGDRSKLTEANLALVKLTEELPQPYLDALGEELAGSHCGVMPASAFGSLSLAQRFRDAHLARALVEAAQANGAAFLLAGNGHVRADRAVPWYVRRLAPDRNVISVMLLEVRPGLTDAAAYLPRDPDGKVAADYVIFTPPQDRPDPCEQLRERYKNKQ